MIYDLPHPGLLPKEKENRSPPHAKICDWICRPVIRKTRMYERCSFSPGEKATMRAGVTKDSSPLQVDQKPLPPFLKLDVRDAPGGTDFGEWFIDLDRG